MNNFYSNIKILEKNNLNNIIDLFIERINESHLNIKFSNFLSISTKLIDSLIDICIKNKINYFITNHISFSSIKSNFKLELETRLLKSIKNIYPAIEINIQHVLLSNIENWNEVINVLSKKIETKNKVSFNPTATQYTYEIDEEHNRKSKKKSKAVKIVSFEFDKEERVELTTEERIALYLKVIFINGKYINDVKYILNSMSLILNNPGIEYDILSPYKNV